MGFGDYVKKIIGGGQDFTSEKVVELLKSRGVDTDLSTIRRLRSGNPEVSGRNLYRRYLAQALLNNPSLSPKASFISAIGNSIVNVRQATTWGNYGLKGLRGDIASDLRITEKQLANIIMATRADILVSNEVGINELFKSVVENFLHALWNLPSSMHKNAKVEEIDNGIAARPTPDVVYPFLAQLNPTHLAKFGPYEGEVFVAHSQLTAGINTPMDERILEIIASGGGLSGSITLINLADDLRQQTGLLINDAHLYDWAKHPLGINADT